MNALKIISATLAVASLPGTLQAETWVGIAGTDWSASGNWSGQQVPTSASTTTALINNTSGDMPVIDGINAAAHSVTVGQSTDVTAYLTIRNGGTLTTQENSYIGGIFNASAKGVGHVLVTGLGSQWNAKDIRVGLQSASIGNTLSVRDKAVLNAAGNLIVGVGGGASLTVDGAATITGLTGLTIGNDATSSGAASLSGIGTSVTSSGAVIVAKSGSGSLSLEAGAVVSGGAGLTIGDSGTASGTVTIDGIGSKLAVAGTLTIGNSGEGSLTLSNSATATAASLGLASTGAASKGYLSLLSGGTLKVDGGATFRGGSSTNEVIIDGGALTTGLVNASNAFNIGNAQGGSTEVTVRNGGSLTTGASATLSIGDLVNSTGSVTVTGGDSSLTAYGIRVGGAGSGTLSITEGATVTVGGGNVTLGNSAGSSGTLYIGKGGGAGHLSATSINSSQANAKIVFNHHDTDYEFNTQIVGTVAVEVNGTGETILNSASANSYTGGTVVNSGELRIKSGANNWLAATGDIRLSGGRFNLGANSLALTTGKLILDGGELLDGTLSKSSGDFDVRSGIVAAALSGNAGLVKTTSGTVSLSGANTYTGATTVNAGTLLVLEGGSLAASSHVTVEAGGTLGGNGVVHGNVTLNGGTLDVGEETGAFTIGGNLVLNESVTIFDIESPLVFDSLVGIQAITYGGTLRINIDAGLESGTFKLFSFESRLGESLFSDILFSDGYSGAFDYSTGELSFAAVPEPGHLALFGFLAMGICTGIYRRKQARGV